MDATRTAQAVRQGDKGVLASLAGRVGSDDWEEVAAVLPVGQLHVQCRTGLPAEAGGPSIAPDRPSPRQQLSPFLYHP